VPQGSILTWGTLAMQPSSLRLTDDELDSVFRACRPLQPHLRDAFMQRVADILAGENEIGPGAVFRAVRPAQKEFFDPPTLTNDMHGGLIERRVRLERVERGVLREAERKALKTE
jgi:hypothetical protein